MGAQPKWPQLALRGSIEQVFKGEFESVVQYRGLILSLRDSLSELPARLEKAAHENEFFNIDLATQLIAAAETLLTLCEENASADFVPYYLAAVSYYLNSEDAQNDFKGIDGLEDDRAVFEAVAKAFGHSERISSILKRSAE